MRALVVIASGVFAFVLTCLLVEHLLPRELPPLVREKVTYLAMHGNEYDALFLGSSRVAYHIMPALFDRAAAEQGLAIKSFNAGIPGMFTPQDAYVLDRILESKPARIHWIVLELQPLRTWLQSTERADLETVYWHDWPRFSLLCRRLAGSRKYRHWQDRLPELAEVLPELGGHALLFARRFSNLGRGSLLLQRWISHEQAPPVDWGALGENRDGWRLPRIRGTDEKDVASLAEELQKRRRIPPVRNDRDPATQKAFDLMVAKIRGAGATPVLLIPPYAGNGSYFYPKPELAQQLIILDFCDPRKYPELYELKYRVDTSHLNPAGSEIFTRLLAKRFVEATSSSSAQPGEAHSALQDTR